MKKILNAISGHKTYIISGATIVYVIIGVALHFITIPAGLTLIGGLSSLAALRLGVAKVQGILELVLETIQLIDQVLPAPSVTTTVATTTATPEATTIESTSVTEVPAPTTVTEAPTTPVQ